MNAVPNSDHRIHIVVLGGGFAGLAFCKQLNSPRARITLVDRQNHHLFQPLLYQVGTAGLSAPDIAQPIRAILAPYSQVRVLMAEVQRIDLQEKTVEVPGERLRYDYLVIGLGGVTNYFGHPEWAQHAPGLKSLDEALTVRRDVLLSYEKAEAETDPAKQDELLTMLVIGGGPTGVETAGALAELGSILLRRDFRRIAGRRARVLLLEGSDRLLAAFPPALSESAKQQLQSLNVEVHCSAKVQNISANRVELADGRVFRAGVILWTAGVGANPLTRQLGVELDRAGRIKVAPDCSVPGHPEVFAVGDIAALVDTNGRAVPGVSPAAIQMAKHVARIITEELKAGPASKRPAFSYWDKGSMATIGRFRAVAAIGKLHFGGYFAWVAWLCVHLIFLVGFRNKFSVFVSWIYSYFRYKRGARIITGLDVK